MNAILQEFTAAAEENRKALEHLASVFQPRDPNEAQDSDFPATPLDPQEQEMNDASNY